MKKFLIIFYLLIPLNVKSNEHYYHYHIEALISVMKNDKLNFPLDIDKKRVYDISKINKCEYSISIDGKKFSRKYDINICQAKVYFVQNEEIQRLKNF